ncbi:MOSC domain-containing protein [Dactylosporangium sp. NPDC051485]|uniref:MOSC domain-containing protein n=1 Tax=Dactylosporangium sp. NPDC051485 TaxID=3154846 RepID=UPI003420ADC3
MAHLLSVNVGTPTLTEHSDVPYTGIDKRPVEGPVAIAVPGPRGTEPTGVAGDRICDTRHHGGPDQAVYAYAREDLDRWAGELGRELPGGVFGENLTTSGLDVTGARIGERWLIGERTVLEVCAPRIPCRTFAGWLGERGWIKRFTERAEPGAYLRVIEPGEVRAGDGIRQAYVPEHTVTVGLAFRALTTEPDLLPRLLEAGEALPARTREKVLHRLQ